MTTTTGPDLLAVALSIAADGVPVFPCSPRTKAPLVPSGFKAATTDAEQIQTWWETWPDALIGSPTGKRTNRLVIDTDSPRAKEELHLLAEQAGTTWPDTFTVGTHDGEHAYFNYPGNVVIGNSSRNMPDSVDVRGEGGYVILPPSPHPEGGRYEIINHTPKVDVPMWLFKLLVDWDQEKPVEIREATAGWAMRQYVRMVAELRRAVEGNRNARLNSAAWWASRLSGHPLLTEKATSAEIKATAQRLGLGDGEIRATWGSAWRGGQEKRIKILAIEETTDLGNADRFILKNGNLVRYVPAFNAWHVWDGHHWKPDAKKQVRKMAQDTVRDIHREAAGIEDQELRKRIARWAFKSEESKRIAAMLQCVEPNLAVEPVELDSDLEALNLENCTLDLRTGEVREQQPSDLITRMLPVSFDPKATCPVFEKHMKLVLPDEEVRDYFQEDAAYSLSGSVGEQCIHILWGDGENGKSVTVDVLRRMAGSYGWPAPRLLFAGGYHDIAPHQIADLLGRRFVTCSEFKKGDVLRVEVMKALTGGGASEQTGAKKYGHAFQFTPQAKFLLDTNYLLEVDSPDYGTWRRIRLIHFNQTITDKVKKDPHFDRKLWAERSGILNWIIAGLRRWNARDRTLVVPRTILEASKCYEQEQDLLMQFIEAGCIRDPKAKVEMARFTRNYQEWLKGRSMAKSDRVGIRALKDQVIKKGFVVTYDPQRRYDIVVGLAIRELYGDL